MHEQKRRKLGTKPKVKKDHSLMQIPFSFMHADALRAEFGGEVADRALERRLGDSHDIRQHDLVELCLDFLSAMMALNASGARWA